MTKTFKTVAEEWFEQYAKPNLRSTTYERMLMLRERTYNALGKLAISSIKPKHIQVFINSLSKEGANLKTGAPLSPKTITHYLSFISDVFTYALRYELVKDNPCRSVILPKKIKKEKKIYSQEEMNRLFERINGEPLKYQAFFYLIAYSGLRRSEMLGLEWKDVDFDNCIISVRRSSNYTAGRGIYTDCTKTDSSVRCIKISAYIMDILGQLKEEQNCQAKLNKEWTDSDRLFTKKDGSPMNPQTPYGWLKEFCSKNTLPFYGIHSFRHFAASALISAGLDVTTVSRTLGHSTPTTTLNVYSHVFQNAQAKASSAMDEAFAFLRTKPDVLKKEQKEKSMSVFDLERLAKSIGKTLKIEFV